LSGAVGQQGQQARRRAGPTSIVGEFCDGGGDRVLGLSGPTSCWVVCSARLTTQWLPGCSFRPSCRRCGRPRWRPVEVSALTTGSVHPPRQVTSPLCVPAPSFQLLRAARVRPMGPRPEHASDCWLAATSCSRRVHTHIGRSVIGEQGPHSPGSRSVKLAPRARHPSTRSVARAIPDIAMLYPSLRLRRSIAGSSAPLWDICKHREHHHPTQCRASLTSPPVGPETCVARGPEG
jgi:hypothetical protein